MNELDLEALEGVRAWAQSGLDRAERRKRMAPLYEAVQESFRITSSQTIPALMAGPISDARRSVLALEQSLAEWPRRMAEQETRYETELTRVRRRTTALRSWLEALA